MFRRVRGAKAAGGSAPRCRGIIMRIITGSARGRRLVSPEDAQVRPTTDKVKESLFSIIQFEIEGRSVLDLFAGSGQLGLEAISRGAEWCTFVDASAKSLAVVRKNIALTGFADKSEVVQRDAFAFLAAANRKFDLVFLDPPYDQGLCVRAAEVLPRVLKETSVVICETHADETLPAAIGSLRPVREYRYSAIKLTVFRKAADDAAKRDLNLSGR